jgi:hypothetical protein
MKAVVWNVWVHISVRALQILLPHCVRKSSDAHPSSYPMSTKECFRTLKEVEAWNLSPDFVFWNVECMEPYLHSPRACPLCGLSFQQPIKHQFNSKIFCVKCREKCPNANNLQVDIFVKLDNCKRGGYIFGIWQIHVVMLWVMVPFNDVVGYPRSEGSATSDVTMKW